MTTEELKADLARAEGQIAEIISAIINKHRCEVDVSVDTYSSLAFNDGRRLVEVKLEATLGGE